MSDERQGMSISPEGAAREDDAVAMSGVQQLITTLVPRSWAESMEAASREWMVQCRACGFERSLWELGGIRWKATGSKWTWGRCPHCSKWGVHKIYRRVSTDSLNEA